MSGTAETIAGVTIPDTALVRDTTEFIRDAEDDVLFHHSRRVFLFGVLQAAAADWLRTPNCSTSPPCSTTSG